MLYKVSTVGSRNKQSEGNKDNTMLLDRRKRHWFTVNYIQGCLGCQGPLQNGSIPFLNVCCAALALFLFCPAFVFWNFRLRHHDRDASCHCHIKFPFTPILYRHSLILWTTKILYSLLTRLFIESRRIFWILPSSHKLSRGLSIIQRIWEAATASLSG